MKSTEWIVRGTGLAMVLGFALAMALPVRAQGAATGAPASVQQPAAATGMRVAVINGERVINESTIGMQVQQEAQRAAEDWDNRVRTKQSELDALVAQAQQQRLTLTEDALARIQQQIEQLQVDVQRLQDDAQRALTRMADDAQIRINERLIPAVEQLAQQEGYDLILDTRLQGILYFADAIDATDRYIALVNAGDPAAQRDN